MNAGERIELDIDGIVGTWEKMQNYKTTGAPTPGIKPFGAMAQIWPQEFSEKRKNQVLPVREVTTADRYLATLSASLSEWDSPQDEAAYGDL